MADYEKIKRLGAGTFGVVWLVKDRALGVNRALKIVNSNRISNPTNFYHEPQTLRQLKHPNIVAVEDAGITPAGNLYIAMEYIRRGSIEDIAKGGIFPLRHAIEVIEDTCRGIEYAHNQQYIHRDIKPANILLTHQGRAKVSDFGLATRAHSDGTASAYGYIAHLAPEVLTSGTTSKRSDIYAMGVTLYRLVNGDAYLPDLRPEDDLETMIIEGKYPNRRHYRSFIPQRLRVIINKAMNTDSDSRYTSASELRQALEHVSIKCDWESEAVRDGVKFSTTIGDIKFEATLTKHNRGKFDFVLIKGRIGKSKRKVSEDTLYGGGKMTAMRHAHKILSRITQHGR